MKTLKRISLFIGLKISEIVGAVLILSLALQVFYTIGFYSFYILDINNKDGFPVAVDYSYFFNSLDDFIGALFGVLVVLGSLLILSGLVAWFKSNWQYVKRKIK